MTGDILLHDDELSENQSGKKTLDRLSISPLPKNDQLSDNQPVQKTLDGLSVSALPKVRTTDGFMLNWDRNIIVNQLLKETKLSEIFYAKPAITKEEAVDIAKEAEKIIRKMNIKFLSGPLIREIVNNILLDRGRVEWRNIMTRVGASVYDAYEIDSGYGFGANDNANQLNNAETSHKRKADKMSKEQNLLLMPKELADLHLNGDFHIHDLEYMGTRPFCQDWDLRYFFYYGLMPDGVGTQSSVAKPAKNAEVAFLHAVKAMGSAQTNFAGGQGFYNFLTFIAPYLEGKSEVEIKQLMQMFVYEMMQMMCARGGQTVFSSVQLSPGVPKLWKNIPVVAMGKVWDGKHAPLRTYGEFEKEVRLGFKALMDVMLEGDAWGKPFSFPKPEISLEPDFMQEDESFNEAHPEIPTYKELYRLTFELAAKFGTPYFDNQLPEYRGAGEGISCYQCCAYQFSANPTDDKEFDDKLHFKDGKHFSMGSWMVLSLNCPRAAYRAEYDDEKLFTELKTLMNRCVEVFKIKRRWMNSLIKKNRIPFASQCPKDPNTGEKGSMAVDFESLVYTIGVVGINEMVQYHTGYQIHESPVAYKLAIRAMFEMKMHAQKLSKENDMEIALARTPAETTAQRFAVSDLLHWEYAEKAEFTIKGDLKSAKKEINETHDLPIYYTNGTHIPPGADVSLPERIKYEHTFFPIVDGGNIMHIWLGEGKPDPEGLQELAMHIAKNTQTGYFAFTRDMTVCIDEGYVAAGLLDKCPKCGSEHVQHLSRITGYLQSVEGWNRGKRQELKDRKRYGTRELR
ncbi:TPA: anaerobic ribonucleoside-triphosphate reductase [Methanosarcina acetivorans]|uniref:Anaerobic ribonucleoside-triphosphate reductase n=2 Tax=Methanosarcina acetivorans TaxID=2214 RepID=Q8TUJ5_METAC|nr:anaerobic ribonucleoside-triphosphate reductase [Methanosarcina acetivorans]AAM03526.1 anaerobic ribonucleoside-triphosphate reductase [Methanosarcina acetivorans C2A]HIH93203.1 anaerobic ribonucleoside-triphosphate reductase [Methanosarcina acetivorans]